MATTERGSTTKEGKEIPERTQWHNCVVKRTGMAGIVEQYVKKGTPLLVKGKIETRDYEDNAGQKRYITEIIVEEMELLGGGQKHETAPAPEPEPAPGRNPDMPF
jgi:single-strand DNA-binding protein